MTQRHPLYKSTETRDFLKQYYDTDWDGLLDGFEIVMTGGWGNIPACLAELGTDNDINSGYLDFISRNNYAGYRRDADGWPQDFWNQFGGDTNQDGYIDQYDPCAGPEDLLTSGPVAWYSSTTPGALRSVGRSDMDGDGQPDIYKMLLEIGYEISGSGYATSGAGSWGAPCCPRPAAERPPVRSRSSGPSRGGMRLARSGPRAPRS